MQWTKAPCQTKSQPVHQYCTIISRSYTILGMWWGEWDDDPIHMAESGVTRMINIINARTILMKMHIKCVRKNKYMWCIWHWICIFIMGYHAKKYQKWKSTKSEIKPMMPTNRHSKCRKVLTNGLVEHPSARHRLRARSQCHHGQIPSCQNYSNL